MNALTQINRSTVAHTSGPPPGEGVQLDGLTAFALIQTDQGDVQVDGLTAFALIQTDQGDVQVDGLTSFAIVQSTYP